MKKIFLISFFLISATVVSSAELYNFSFGTADVDGTSYQVGLYMPSPLAVHSIPMNKLSWATPIDAYMSQYTLIMESDSFAEMGRHYTEKVGVPAGWTEEKIIAYERSYRSAMREEVQGVIKYSDYLILVVRSYKGDEINDTAVPYIMRNGEYIIENRSSVIMSDPFLMQLSTDGWDFDAWKAQVKADKGE